MYGVDVFDAILPPGQGAILAVRTRLGADGTPWAGRGERRAHQVPLVEKQGCVARSLRRFCRESFSPDWKRALRTSPDFCLSGSVSLQIGASKPTVVPVLGAIGVKSIMKVRRNERITGGHPRRLPETIVGTPQSAF